MNLNEAHMLKAAEAGGCTHQERGICAACRDLYARVVLTYLTEQQLVLASLGGRALAEQGRMPKGAPSFKAGDPHTIAAANKGGAVYGARYNFHQASEAGRRGGLESQRRRRERREQAQQAQEQPGD